MQGSALRRRRAVLGTAGRPGLTLVEVSLAGVIGTILLISMVYTSREMRVATDAVYTETYLQSAARVLGDDVDNVMPMVFAQYVSNSANTTIWMSKDSVSPANTEALVADLPAAEGGRVRLPGVGAMGLQLGDDVFMLAASSNQATATPTTAPTASTTSTTSPYALSTSYPSPTYTLTTATAWATPAPMAPASKPSYTQVTSSNDTTMTLGTWRMRYQDPATNSDTGGTLLYTDSSGNWKPFGTQGTHGLVEQANFNFGNWTPTIDSTYATYAFTISSNISTDVVQLVTKLGKSDGVPFYLQQVWSPRTTTWSWMTSAVTNGPTSGSSLPYFPNGGLFPIAVDESYLKTATAGVTTVDVWDTTGPGNIGWTSWDTASDTGTLDAELTNMGSQTFVDQNISGNSQLRSGSGVDGLPGHKTPDKSVVNTMTSAGSTVTCFCYNSKTLKGTNLTYTVGAFAKFQLTNTAADGSTGSDYLKFIGWADSNGNMLPSGYTPF